MENTIFLFCNVPVSERFYSRLVSDGLLNFKPVMRIAKISFPCCPLCAAMLPKLKLFYLIEKYL